MESTTTFPPVTEQAKQYLETKFKLLKYESIDKASSLIAEVINDVIMMFMLLITFLFFSVVIALFASYYLHSAWEGFGCVTLLYAIFALNAGFFQPRLQNILIKKFIEKLYRKRNS